MKVIQFPKKIEMNSPTIIMGAFDVIHIGHLELLKQAQKNKTPIAILLLDDPSKLPQKTSEFYEALEVRLQKIANLKIDYAIVLTLNNKIMATTAVEFINQLKIYKPSNIVVGQDFRFGFKAQGDTDLLEQHFKTQVIPIKKISNKKISSSIIKEQIPFGDIKFANSLTVGPWTTNVTINKDNHFILPKKQIQPHSGFYAATFIIKNKLFHGVVHVTRQGKNKIYLLNNKDNLQNKEISISWWQQILITIKDSNDLMKDEYLKSSNVFFKNSL